MYECIYVCMYARVCVCIHGSKTTQNQAIKMATRYIRRSECMYVSMHVCIQMSYKGNWTLDMYVRMYACVYECVLDAPRNSANVLFSIQ